jgi:integrase
MPDDRRLTPTGHPGVFKRGDGYVVRFRDPNGRTRKRCARTLTDAIALRATLRADVIRGEYRDVSQLTLGEYAPEWLVGYAGRTSRGIRAQTLADYRRLLEHPTRGAIAFLGARTKLAALTAPAVKGYARSLHDAGLRPKTVRNYLAPVKAMLADAYEDGLIRTNPAARVRVTFPASPAAPQRPKALSANQLAALIANALRHQTLILLMAATGLRVGEAIALLWDDIDFGRGRVRVSRRLYRDGYGPPKSRNGLRDVPLAPLVAHALGEHRKTTPGELVFPGPNGNPLSQPTVYRAIQDAGRSAGLGHVNCHMLRHSCASILFRDGANAIQVQHWLGHHSPAFTLATYVHLLEDDLPDPTVFDALATRQRGHSGATAPTATDTDQTLTTSQGTA